MHDADGSPGAALLSPLDTTSTHARFTQAAERAGFLARVSRGLTGSLHTERAIDLVLEMLTEAVVDWAQVTMLDRRAYVFHARRLDGTRVFDQLATSQLPASSSLAHVLTTGSTDLVLVPDGEDAHSDALISAVPSQSLRETVTSIRPMDMLTVALTARGTTYGALTVARRGGDGFDQSAVAFLEEFAHRVSVVLDATRALAESRRVATVLSRDLNPPSLPDLPGVRLATYYRVAFEHEALGGDFYDVNGDADDWTVVMGDVCGKGVEAAVLTGKVRQAVRTATLVDRDPAAVLGLVNRVLCADGVDTFVTTVCARGRRDGDDVVLEVASAGHPGPVLVRADGSVDDVPVSGTVLGLLDWSTYDSVEVRLGPDETCVFFTDGVTEASGHRARFGEARLHEVLAETGCCDARAQVESLAMALTAHLRDRAHDDIAILAVQADPGADRP